MKPYFETDLGVLYHGDCLEIMPQLSRKGTGNEISRRNGQLPTGRGDRPEG
jgi:hypothetical protein